MISGFGVEERKRNQECLEGSFFENLKADDWNIVDSLNSRSEEGVSHLHSSAKKKRFTFKRCGVDSPGGFQKKRGH